MNIREVPNWALNLDAHTARRQLAELLDAVEEAVRWVGRIEQGLPPSNGSALLRQLKDDAERITGRMLQEYT